MNSNSNDTSRTFAESSRGAGKSSELLRAKEMLGFSFGSDRIDVRGWKVYADDGKLVGTVDSIFVDMHAKAVRYLGVKLVTPRAVVSRGTVLVPIGSASRPDDREIIVLNTLKLAQLMSAPRVPNRPVTRTDENAALSVYGLATWRDETAGELYKSPSFEERRLFGEPGSRN